MKLLVLMYHRARAERHGNAPEVLDAHFGHIARSFGNVLPGDPIAGDRLHVCLSFDDGYFDFHDVVFPLLRKWGLRALLAVPPRFVEESTTAGRESRRAIDSREAFANPKAGGFCTWGELDEMAASGQVVIAAHGYSHQRLDSSAMDYAMEIDRPQSLLAGRLSQPVTSFVFPFGRYDGAALARARRHYRYIFRIGGAMNRGWDGRVLYRVDADRMGDPAELFSASRLAGYRARYFWNRLRGR